MQPLACLQQGRCSFEGMCQCITIERNDVGGGCLPSFSAVRLRLQRTDASGPASSASVYLSNASWYREAAKAAVAAWGMAWSTSPACSACAIDDIRASGLLLQFSAEARELQPRRQAAHPHHQPPSVQCRPPWWLGNDYATCTEEIQCGETPCDVQWLVHRWRCRAPPPEGAMLESLTAQPDVESQQPHLCVKLLKLSALVREERRRWPVAAVGGEVAVAAARWRGGSADL